MPDFCYGYGIQTNIDWKNALGSEWRQYEEIFPALNASRIDQVSLECINSRVPLPLLGFLPNKDVLVGAIDVATNTIESADEMAAALCAAMVHVASERLVACTNCGIAPLPRKVAEDKLKPSATARSCSGKNWRARSGLPAPIPRWQ